MTLADILAIASFFVIMAMPSIILGCAVGYLFAKTNMLTALAVFALGNPLMLWITLKIPDLLVSLASKFYEG